MVLRYCCPWLDLFGSQTPWLIDELAWNPQVQVSFRNCTVLYLQLGSKSLSVPPLLHGAAISSQWNLLPATSRAQPS